MKWKMFYTAIERVNGEIATPDGERKEGEIVVEARDEETAIKIIKYYLELHGKKFVHFRNLQCLG